MPHRWLELYKYVHIIMYYMRGQSKSPLATAFLGSAILPLEHFPRFKELTFNDTEQYVNICKY